MGATQLITTEKEAPEGYTEEIDVATDGLDAAGFYPQTGSPGDMLVGIDRDAGNNLVLKDPVAGAKTLASLGGGLTENQHEALNTLDHDIAQTSYMELTRNGAGKVSTITIWTSPAKTIKVRESIFTRDGSGRVIQDTTTQYDSTGAFKNSLTTIFTRDGSGKVVSSSLTKI